MEFSWLTALMLVLLLLCGGIYGKKLYRAVRQWQQKQARLDAINKEYENLRSVRKDAVYHHGWAQSRGDWKEARELFFFKQYHFVDDLWWKTGGTVQLGSGLLVGWVLYSR
eukprot:s5575_g6.t1